MTQTNTALAGILSEITPSEFAGFTGGNEAIQVAGQVTIVKANEWVDAREDIEIGGKRMSFNTRYRLNNPIVTSIALRETNAKTRQGRIDFNATVVAQRDLEVQIGTEWMALENLVIAAIRAANPGIANRSDEEILGDLAPYGFEPKEDLPMYLQHLGANREAFDAVASEFISLGANENTASVTSRTTGNASVVLASYRHEEGIPIVNLEISKANRSQSESKMAGFIGFLDAAWGSVSHMLVMDNRRSALRAIMASAQASSDNDEFVAAANEEAAIRDQFGTPTRRRAFRNLGGTSKVVDPLDDASVRYYAQQVPCGRFSIMDIKDENPLTAKHTWSVWGTKAESTAGTGQATVAGTMAIAPPDATF